MPNRNGARGIHTAAMKGHVAVINSLIAKGECVDAVTNVSVNQALLFNFRHFFNVSTYITGGPPKLQHQENPQDTLMTVHPLPFTLYYTPQVLKYKLFKAFFHESSAYIYITFTCSMLYSILLLT